jgi:hypothetical protein
MTHNESPKKVTRKSFLKISGLAAAAFAVATAQHEADAISSLADRLFDLSFLDPQAQFGSRLIRGTSGGEIFASADEGKSWERLMSLGSHCAVSSLAVRSDQIYAKVSLGSHGFWLYSSDGRTWRTTV